ncbi:MAG: Cupin 2, conserved barrel [Polaromonas sp.]|nr:Cupin 2, conserved barrel [Polaromonas sp.]
MAIAHAASGQLIDITPLGDRLAQAQSHALCKTDDLEVMRLVIPAQRTVPPHHVDGDLTLQCLEGEVELTTDGRTCQVAAGQMLWLAGGVEYSITARQDASLLVTIALYRPRA